MRWSVFVFSLLMSIAVVAQKPAAETAAATVFNAWLKAFNSGDIAQYQAFDEQFQPPRPMTQMTDFHKQTGGFVLVRVEKNEATVFVALLKEKNSDNIGRAELTVSADSPPKMLGASIRLVPPPADLAPQRLSESDAIAAVVKRIDTAASSDQFSGVMLIARKGKLLLEKAWGRADRDKNVPVTVATQFRVGSMNKMFTAVGILQLVEAKKLGLDDPIGKYLKDFADRDIASKVTIRHLLTHTGGTGDIFGPEFDKNRLSLKSHADYTKLYSARALVHEPGVAFRYSNFGFVLLGAVIEKVSGLAYYDYVQRSIFEPAGMKATGSLPETDAVAMRAQGYMKEAGKWMPNTETLPWRGTAAGGGYSTVGDLLRFTEALQGGKLISNAMLAEATRDQMQSYGFGFGIRGQGAWRGFGHGGGAPGMNGELRIIPVQGYVLVVLSNLDPPAASRELDFVAARLPASQ